jgi:hypothetical protein
MDRANHVHLEASPRFQSDKIGAANMGLPSFMLGPTETTNGPEVAPDGIVIVIDVALQELIVTGAPFSITTLLPCDAPNPVPEITA